MAWYGNQGFYGGGGRGPYLAGGMQQMPNRQLIGMRGGPQGGAPYAPTDPAAQQAKPSAMQQWQAATFPGQQPQAQPQQQAVQDQRWWMSPEQQASPWASGAPDWGALLNQQGPPQAQSAGGYYGPSAGGAQSGFGQVSGDPRQMMDFYGQMMQRMQPNYGGYGGYGGGWSGGLFGGGNLSDMMYRMGQAYY